MTGNWSKRGCKPIRKTRDKDRRNSMRLVKKLKDTSLITSIYFVRRPDNPCTQIAQKHTLKEDYE